MFIVILYLVSFVVWSLITIELSRAIRYNFKNKLNMPRLLIPLLVASSALVLDSSYFFVANIYRIYSGQVSYLLFLDEQYLFLVKVLITISGIIILLGIKRDNRE